MKTYHHTTTVLLILFCGLLFLMTETAMAEHQDLAGWEAGSEYNSLYKTSDMDEIKVTVKKIVEVTPLKGMAPGLGLLVEDSDGEEITAHVGPKSYVRDLAVRPGNKIKMRGAWAEIGEKEIFMISKIKGDGGYVFKIRLTKDGTPFWTMTAEQLLKEKE